MERKVFKLPFAKSGVSRFQCPSCNKGMLRVKKGTFFSEETAASREVSHHPDWEPEWIELTYSCLFECTNSDCSGVVASSGKGSIEEEYIYDDSGVIDRRFDEHFMPNYFIPHLNIFSCPKGTPTDVERELSTAFALVVCDPPSSANHVRIALEHLLTHLKIKRYTTRNNRRHFLTLHSRIDLLPRKYDAIKDLFLAVKWLGNAGSHSTKVVTLDDVFDAFELIEELLVDLFSKKRSHAKALAKKINKKKGPK